MAFHVGQKVECIDDSPSYFNGASSKLKKGAIYTVTSCFISWQGTPAVLLAETETDIYHDGFLAKRFRPIVETSTDTGMAILREILDRETIKDERPVKVPARQHS